MSALEKITNAFVSNPVAWVLLAALLIGCILELQAFDEP
jgi:hypothetical protein